MDKLLDQFSAQISEAVLKPSTGGRYEVSVDGDLVFSKLELDRFPEEDEIEKLISDRIGA